MLVLLLLQKMQPGMEIQEFPEVGKWLTSNK